MAAERRRNHRHEVARSILCLAVIACCIGVGLTESWIFVVGVVVCLLVNTAIGEKR